MLAPHHVLMGAFSSLSKFASTLGRTARGLQSSSAKILTNSLVRVEAL
jgi:hypothetical protein